MKRNININRLEFETDTIESVWEIFSRKISLDEKGYSILDLHKEDDVIEGKIIRRHSTYIRDYDYKSEKFEDKKIFVYSEIRFGIDFNQNMLYSFGAAANFNSVKIVLRQILSNYQLKTIDLSIREIIGRISKGGFAFEINEIAINNFSYEDSIVGKFVGGVKNTKSAIRLLEEYGSDVYRLNISLTSKNSDELKLVLTNVNAFRIQSDEDNFEDNFNIIKQIFK